MFERDEQQLIEQIVGELRKPVRVDRAAKARLMAAVRAAPRPRVRTESRSWLARPWSVPLAGLAAALIGIVAVRMTTYGPQPEVGVPAAPELAARRTTNHVQFVLVAPAASNVSLVGDFNDWDTTATPLRQSAPSGVWSVVVPLTRGRHLYAFVVDGTRWMLDPSAPQAPEADFGSPNSVVIVGTPST